MTHFLHVGLLFLWLLYCGELEVISFLSSYRCTKIIMMQSNDYNLIFPMTVWYKQDKQSAGRSDEVVFKPDWVTVGFTVLPPPLTISRGDCHAWEKKGSGATVQEQKALRVKLRMSTAAMHVLWKQSDVRERQCVFTSAPFQMTAIRLDNRSPLLSSLKDHLQHGFMKSGHCNVIISEK